MAERRWRHGQGAFGGDDVGPNRTARAQNGTKRSLTAEANGDPLGVVEAGANISDTRLLRHTIEAIVVGRPMPTDEAPQHLCLDKGYDSPMGRRAVVQAQHVQHTR